MFVGEKIVLTFLRRWLTRAIVGLALITVASHLVKATDTLSIADFAGHFRGPAQVEAGNSFFIHQSRDSEVELRTDAKGFRLIWTTIMHYDEGEASNVRRRQTELQFVAGPMPNQFRTPEPLEPFTEKPTAWAYIDANTLIVHVLSILPDGNFELQIYERTLAGEAMTLHFSRLSPGRPELVISGRLTRQPE